MTVDELLAKQEITEVLYRYCRSLDRNDEELYRTVFEPGAPVDYGEYFVGNAEEFRIWVWRAHAAMAATSHQISNVLTEITEDGERAVSEAYVTVCLRAAPDDTGAALDILERARYVDRWRRHSDGSWRVAERVYHSDIRQQSVAHGAAVTPEVHGGVGPFPSVFTQKR